MPFVEDSPYFFPYTQAVKKEAAARGWNLIMTDAKTDLNTQVNQIEDLVSKGLDGLMIVPLDAAGIVPVIDKMYAQTKGKLPIITSNVMTDPPQLKSLKGFAGPNSYLEGKAMGEYYVNYFKKQGPEQGQLLRAHGHRRILRGHRPQAGLRGPGAGAGMGGQVRPPRASAGKLERGHRPEDRGDLAHHLR